MSVTFSSNSGSFETLKVRVRCGFRPASAQIRPALDGEIFMAAAIVERLQCVAFGGFSLTVLAITARRVHQVQNEPTSAGTVGGKVKLTRRH